MDKSLPRITDLAEGRDKPEEKDYIDFFEDMEKSVFGAAQSLGYSFGDLITTGIDAAANTNLTSKLDETYQKNKIESPETLLGSVNKVLIEFGIPGGAVFKVMNRAKKLFKGKKGAQAAAATGAGANAVNIAKIHGMESVMNTISNDECKSCEEDETIPDLRVSLNTFQEYSGRGNGQVQLNIGNTTIRQHCVTCGYTKIDYGVDFVEQDGVVKAKEILVSE